MASIASTALGAGLLGLIYGIAGAPDKVVESISSNEEFAEIINNCNACISYLNHVENDTTAMLESEEKLAMEKCSLIRDLPADKLEPVLRQMLTSADAEKLSTLADTCRTAIHSAKATSHVPTHAVPSAQKEVVPRVALAPAEEEMFTQFSTEWTDMSSFDCTSDSDSDVYSGDEPMVFDML